MATVLSVSSLCALPVQAENNTSVELSATELQNQFDENTLDLSNQTGLINIKGNPNYDEALADFRNGKTVPLEDLIPADGKPVFSPDTDDDTLHAFETSYKNYYVYQYLNSDEKKIFDTIMETDDPFMTSDTFVVTGIKDISNFSPYNPFYAIYRDCPQLFWFDYGRVSCSYRKNSATGTYTIYYSVRSGYSTFYYSDYESVDQIKQWRNQIDSIADDVINNVLDTTNRYTTIESLNKWLVRRVSYNANVANGETVTSMIPYTIPSCFITYNYSDTSKHPVCQSYALTIKYFCDKLEIPCVNVISSSHMWNDIQMENGKWYALDATWNDPVGDATDTDSGYESLGKKYLLVGTNTPVGSYLFKDEPKHQEIEAFSKFEYPYPEKSTSKYIVFDDPKADTDWLNNLDPMVTNYISTAKQLYTLYAYSQTDSSVINSAYSYKLTNDIDMTEYPNIIFGTLSSPFCATVDGNNYTIANYKLTIDTATTPYIGLFGCCQNATLKNIRMENPEITVTSASDFAANASVSPLVGLSSYATTIENCHTIGGNVSVTNKNRYFFYTGGIVGYMHSTSTATLTDCSSSVSFVISSYANEALIGGIVGYDAAGSQISGCKFTGSFTSKSGTPLFSGVIAKSISSKLYNCYAVFTATSGYIYGFAYSLSGSTLENCYASFTKTGGITKAAFVDSTSSSTLTNCYYNSSLTPQTSTDGLSATTLSTLNNNVNKLNSGTISNAYVKGSSYPLLSWENNDITHTHTDIIGDVNDNGTADKTDAALMLKYISGCISNDEWNKLNVEMADADGNGTVNISDVIYILNISN
jgi:hypothetical protein